MKSMSNCKNCQMAITWKTPYTKGDGPLNLDLTPHKCTKKTFSVSQNQSIFDNVKWEALPQEEWTEDMKELVLGLKAMRALAYKDAKDVHPDMPENSNTFGQIVNAGISHLINLAKVKAIRGKK